MLYVTVSASPFCTIFCIVIPVFHFFFFLVKNENKYIAIAIINLVTSENLKKAGIASRKIVLQKQYTYDQLCS